MNGRHAGGTELKILFGEAWLFGVSRQRLTGEVPFAREGNTLCCFGKGLHIVPLHPLLCVMAKLWWFVIMDPLHSTLYPNDMLCEACTCCS